MDEQENCFGTTTTRPSKKRPMNTMMAAAATPKKRVVLGEITNIPKPIFKISTQKEEPIVHASPPDDSQKYADAPLIYHHLRSLEVEENRRPLHNYMEKVQKDITPAMREILVDWLVEVADEYKLVSDTLYLTVNYIDRFLSSHTLARTELQLLGVSSMLVASKFEEITPPHIEDCCYITDNTYTREEVLVMESNILTFLKFNTSNPTTKSFLRMFINAAQENSTFPDLQFVFLACYLAELSLLDYICVRFLPSMIAASAIFLATFTMLPDIHPWSLALQRYAGYKASDLKECILAIHDLQLNRRVTSARALREKYMQHKFKCVAALRPPSEIPRHYFEMVTGKHSSDAQEATLECAKF